MKPEEQDSAAMQLAALQGDEQAAYALALLKPVGRKETRRDTLRAALKVLRTAPLEEARPALVQLYERYARNGGALDYGCYLRNDSLRALRPIVTADELPLLEQAATTYEFPPPTFAEEAGLLRGTALLLIAEVDDALARYHAARLLVDPYSDPMSGEPAATAARMLGALGESLPLYQYVCGGAHIGPPEVPGEVLGEALRGLRSLPVRLISPLVELLRRPEGERPGVSRSAAAGRSRSGGRAPTAGRAGAETLPAAARVGLIDLLLEHDAGPQRTDYLLDELRSGPPELARYLLAAAVAAALTRGQGELLNECIELLRFERRPERVALAADALEAGTTIPAVADLLQRWSSAGLC
jgi:hypothetical protein